MLRPGLFVCALAITACTDNPYVIGEQQRLDSGVDGCEGSLALALQCASFEDQEVGSGWSDVELVDSGVIERASEPVHNGMGALHASTMGMGSVAVVSADFEPLLFGPLYLRAYLYVPAQVPTETINIFFLGDQPSPDPFTGLDINLEDGALQIFSPQIDPQRQTGELTIPRDSWFCFRAEVEIDDVEGSVRLYIDDQLALEAVAIDTLPPLGVHRLRAGVDWSSAQEELFEIYIDDLALDVEPIACD